MTAALETNALNFQLLDKTFDDAFGDHVVDQGAAQAMQCLGLGIVAIAAHDNLTAFNLEAQCVLAVPS